MMFRFALPLVLALAACGRTAPVGPHEALPEVIVASAVDAGQPITAGACLGLEQTCHQGFHCESGTCVLNGGQGQVQVTLQWQNTPRTPEDLDLHLIEPSPGILGSCEIYFGTSGGLFGLNLCGAVGKLDLDANGACVDSDPTGGPGSDTENIIYPAGQSAPKGHYVVRVDYWGECGGGLDVPFEVTVRNGGTLTRRVGVFHPGQSDQGQDGSGLTVLEFDVP